MPRSGCSSASAKLVCTLGAEPLYCRYNEVCMIKKLTAIGNSLGLIIERPILELLKIDKDTPLEVRTDGEGLIIRPAAHPKKARVRAGASRMMKAHEGTLRKLAK
jgi:antitoxin MazE